MGKGYTGRKCPYLFVNGCRHVVPFPRVSSKSEPVRPYFHRCVRIRLGAIRATLDAVKTCSLQRCLKLAGGVLTLKLSVRSTGIQESNRRGPVDPVRTFEPGNRGLHA